MRKKRFIAACAAVIATIGTNGALAFQGPKGDANDPARADLAQQKGQTNAFINCFVKADVNSGGNANCDHSK